MDQCRPPFFCAFHALAINDACRRAGLSFHRFAAFDVQRMVDPIQRPVIIPKVKILKQRAAWRQVLGYRPPLAAGAQDVHQTVYHFTDIDAPLASTSFGRGDQWCNMCLFIIRHVTRVTQFAAIIGATIF